MNKERRVAEKINRRRRRVKAGIRWGIYRFEFNAEAIRRRKRRERADAERQLEEQRENAKRRKALQPKNNWKKFKEKIINKINLCLTYMKGLVQTT